MAIHEAESYFIQLIVCAGGPDLLPQSSGQEPVLLQRRLGREIDVVPDNGPGRIRRVGRIKVQVGCSQGERPSRITRAKTPGPICAGVGAVAERVLGPEFKPAQVGARIFDRVV